MTLHRVLVVDDDKLIGWALARELSAEKMAVHVVVTAEDGLRELRSPNRYDVILLDVHLPDASGLDLLGEIGAVAPDAEVIVMSGDAGAINPGRALDRGAAQFLEKPFDLSEVRAILRSALFAGVERRKHRRYHCRVPIRIAVAPDRGAGAGADDAKALMADVGPGGLRLRTDYPLTAGQAVRPRVSDRSDCFLRFIPPEAWAEVVWVVPAAEGVVAGLRFVL